MANKWSARRYKQVADLLRKSGYNITYKANDRKTFNQRGTIVKLYKEKAAYINFAEFNPRSKTNKKGGTREVSGVKYNFALKKLTPKQRKQALASGLFSKKQFTSGGVFVEKPSNIPASEYKISFEKGLVKIKGGKRKDVIVKMNSGEFAVDPVSAAKRAIGKRKPKNGAALMVNGFRSRATAANLKTFYYYLENELIPNWSEKNESHYDNENEMAEAFTDIFHIRLLY